MDKSSVGQNGIYRSVLDGLDDAVFLFDSENRLQYMNLAAEKLTGLELSESTGSHCEEILDDLDPKGSLNAALISRGKRNSGSLRYGNQNFRFSTLPLSDADENSEQSVILKVSSDHNCGCDIEEKYICRNAENDIPFTPLDPLPSASCSEAQNELSRRDRILAGAVLAINQLLITGNRRSAIDQALEILGYTVDVDRVYIFENTTADSGERMHRLRYEWARDTVALQMNDARFGQLSYEQLPKWHETLSSGRPIKGLTRDLPPKIRQFMQSYDVLSYLVVPVFLEGAFWGFIGFDDCRRERKWDWCDVSVLLTVSGALGGAFGRWQADANLRESEGKYRELVESSNSIIMRRDISGNITFFNEFAQKFFGYTQEEILGRNVVGTIVPPVDSMGRDLLKMIEDIGKNPDRYASNVNENMLSGGDRVWVAWTNRPLINERGEITELLCIGNDITDRRRAEEKIREAHNRLLEIIEFLPDATFVIDREKKVIAWNRAIEEMTGVPKESVLGKGDYIYGRPFYGEHKPMLIDLIDGDIEGIKSDYLFVEEKDGKLYAEAFVPSLFKGQGAYVWVIASPLYDGRGNLVGAIESIRDVTELKTASEELRKRDVLLAGVAAAANALLFTRDFETEIHQALEILGLSAGVDRVYIFQNHLSSSNGDILTSLKYEWHKEEVSSQLGNSPLKSCPYGEFFPRWHEALAAGEIISGRVKDFPLSERAVLESLGTASLMAVPITIKGQYWGIIGFDDCSLERAWSKPEISILRSAAGSIGATIEREQAVEELRKTRDYLENLIDYANAPIIVWDPSFKITRFNHAAERLTGYESSEVMGKPLHILFPSESCSDSLAYIHRTLMGERWDIVEIPILRKDGAVRIVLWNSSTLYDRDGKTVVATIAQGQDITERNQAMEKINYQASMLDQVRNAVAATDLNGNIVYWNRFAQALHQWTAKEILGKNIVEMLVPKETADKMNVIMGEISKDGYYEGELNVKRKDGSTFPAYYIFNVLKDIHGQNIGYVGVSTDITERKRVEEDLRRSKEKAESATRAKSQFLANMSHEIRTPMNAIIGLTGLLLGTEMTVEQRDYVETIRGSGDSLLSIINDILDFSKIDEGKMEIESQPFDLVECMEASLDLVMQSAAKKGLGISYSIGPQVPQRILGDVTRLRQVLVNLLSNAVKFTDHGDISVAVSCQPVNRYYEVTFCVQDTGIGISQDRMNRLFQTFSQVDASMTRKYGGTGLGLAISKRLVELMGGRIWAESVPQKGSTFYFTILSAAAPVPSLAHLAGKKALTVSASEPLRTSLCNQLESWLMETKIAASCRDARDIVSSETFDIVMLDLETEAADQLMEGFRERRAPPVIAIGSPNGVVASFAATVTRPVRTSSLAEALSGALREIPGQRISITQLDLPRTYERTDRPPRILLAEDNAVNQKVAMRMLERLGYRADAVANGLEVLQALERQPYDLVLMDVQMPEMDGLEATRRIRGMQSVNPLYIIAMTAHAMKGDREECMAAGMDDYVSKPVRMEELQLALMRSIGHGTENHVIDQRALENLRKLQREGDPDIVQELSSTFLDRTPARISAMKEAVSRGDAGALRVEAHNLKSSSANLGALRLSMLCKELETMGRLGDLQDAESLMEKAEAEYERVRRALELEISGRVISTC